MKLTYLNRKEYGARSHKWILWPFEEYSSPHASLYADFHYRHVGFTVSVGGEDRDISLSFGLGFYVVASLRVLPWSFRKWTYAWANRRADANKARGKGSTWAHELDPMDGRETGFTIHDGSVWVNLWHNDSCWASGDKDVWPWEGNGWNWTIHVVDWLLGPMEYEKGGVVDEEDVYVTMPEGGYPAHVTINKVRWGRRWRKGPWHYRASVDLLVPIPFPGKGENSWDCDDDATHAVTLAAEPDRMSVSDAARKVAMDALQTRERRGGLDWRPAKGWSDRVLVSSK